MRAGLRSDRSSSIRPCDTFSSGVPAPVSKKEFALLRTLAAEPVRVFTREELLRGIWGYQSMVPTRTLDSHASRLRRKLWDAGAPGLIVNVWGVGYRLVDTAVF